MYVGVFDILDRVATPDRQNLTRRCKAPMTAATPLDALQRRGLELRTSGGRLEVRPSGRLTPVERGALRTHLSELLAQLAWNQDVALRSMEDAAALVEQLGASGRDPRVQAAAGAVTDAYAARDSAASNTANATFRALVRQLAGVPLEESEHGPSSNRPRHRETDDPRQAPIGTHPS